MPDGLLLEYSPPVRRRRWRRYLLAMLLLAIIGTGVWFRKPIIGRAQLLYWQHQCLTYTRPPGVAITDANGNGDLDFEVDSYWMNDGSTKYVYSLVPECWKKLRYGPLATQEMRLGRSGTAFLHERVSPAGHRRLVHVECLMANALTLPEYLRCDVCTPATPWSALVGPAPHRQYQYSGRSVPATLYFGQPDPADASHFTIDFTAEDRRGTIDGWLQDDDTVRLKLRDPASTRGL